MHMPSWQHVQKDDDFAISCLHGRRTLTVFILARDVPADFQHVPYSIWRRWVDKPLIPTPPPSSLSPSESSCYSEKEYRPRHHSTQFSIGSFSAKTPGSLLWLFVALVHGGCWGWNFKEFTAQQTQVYLRLSWGSGRRGVRPKISLRWQDLRLKMYAYTKWD